MVAAMALVPNPPADTQTSRIKEVFERQRETAIKLRTSTAAQRIAKIKTLRDAVLANAQAFYDAGYADFKKPPAEVDLAEILPVIAEANDAIRSLKGWMKPQRVWPSRAMWGTRGYLQFEPRGRCLIISPWNYPVNLTFGPLVSALAAGNAVILKPALQSVRTAWLVARC